MGNVLLVENDRRLARDTCEYLERRGHRCRVASSLQSAQRMLGVESPDIVAVSASLPDGNGIGVITALLGVERDLPILMTFDEDHAHLSTEVLEGGAFDAFIKVGDSAGRLAGRIDAILGDLDGEHEEHTPSQLLAEANALLRTQLETISEGLMVVDRGGRVANFNGRFLDLWGLPSQEVEGVDARRVLAGLFAGSTPYPGCSAAPQDAVDCGSMCLEDQRVEVAGGRVISWSTQPVRLDDGQCFGRAFGFRDLTAQIAAEEQVRLQSTLLEHVPSAVVATAMDGTIRYWNRFAEQLLGWPASEAIGKDVRALLFPLDRSRDEIDAMMFDRGGWNGEVELERRDGTSFPALLTFTRLDDTAGRPPMVIGVVNDLSDRRGLEARLLQAQKMEAVGTLAGGLAHDFNNLLTGVLGSAGLAREMDPSEDLGELIDMIERAALRGRDLCSQLLSFSRAERPQVEAVNTIDTITEVVKIVERTFPREVRVSVQTADDLPALVADRSRINQALMNLLVNARDAMEGGGPLAVRARLSEGIPADELHAAEGHGTRYVRLEVEDSGTGMPRDVVRRMFEPFFTTKGSGKGTGLGMSMVFSIARAHGGAVRVWSKPGQGTTVALFIPAAEDTRELTVSAESAFDQDLARYAGNETILVVDDEAIVRSVGARVLKQFGYRTLEAGSGPEAMDIVGDRANNVAAILLDMVMPEMEGPEVFRRLQERGHDIPVLLCSGFSVAGNVDGLLAEGAAGFVQKPYRLRELLPKLRAALDRRGAVASA